GTPPSPRAYLSAVYDPANNVMTVFGGLTSFTSFSSEVWTLSHANGLGGTPAWQKLSPTGGPPDGLASTSAVYASVNDIMTVFAGTPLGGGVTNSVWTLSHANGLGGTPVWTNIIKNAVAGSPAKRSAHGAIYDSVNNRMTIFGGGDSTTGFG